MSGGNGFTSLGRGGAGNMVSSSKSPPLHTKDLVTPTLKTSMVTTGRGGQGNMAKNDDPVTTRARQDVGPVTRQDSHGAAHSGRGGAGNFFQEGEQAHLDTDSTIEDKAEGFAAKGKALLFGKKDKHESKHEKHDKHEKHESK